jgi:hypothetical protein
VNYRAAGEATARAAETLDEAIALGRSMAAQRPLATANAGKATARDGRAA